MAVGLADEEEAVTCVLCRNGTVAPGLVTLTVQRGQTTVILKEVPADVCPNCGEYYLASETTALVLAQLDGATQSLDELLRGAPDAAARDAVGRAFGWMFASLAVLYALGCASFSRIALRPLRDRPASAAD